MAQCSFCGNNAIKQDENGYFYCRKCIIEEIKFLLMSKEEQCKLIILYEKQLTKIDELLDLEKKRIYD